MSTRRSVIWAFAGQFATAAVAFGSSVAIARLLSPYELGLNAVAVATSGILSIVAASGADALIVREVQLTRQVVAAATTVNAILSACFAVGLMAISFAAGPLLGDEKAGEVLRILALVPLVNIVTFRPAAMLQRTMRFKTASLIALANVIVANAVTIAGILLGFGYRSPAVGTLTACLVSFALYALSSPAEVKPSFALQGTRRMALFGFRMVSVTGMGQFVQYFSQILLGRFLGINVLGLYSRAASLANFIYANLYSTATRVAFAQLSKDYRETGQVRETFLRSFYIIISVMWPLLAGLAILSRPVITLLYGERWLSAALPFSLLLVAQMFTLSFGMNWELFVIRDRLAVQTRYEITRSLIGLAIFAFGCTISMVAATVGRIMDAAIGLVMYFAWMGRLADAQPREIVAIYLRSGLLALVAVAPAAALMIATDWDARVSWLWLGGAITTGIIGWAVVLALLTHPLLTELRVISSAALRPLLNRRQRPGVHPSGDIPASDDDRLPIDERF
jgi:O-antigen/teichoic acid export membrane protein